ncbi:MAG: hypothetical protein JST31_16585 [Actinobacteria bacterium]|nr:hypothetical protein [Actinomycetota bacterium]
MSFSRRIVLPLIVALAVVGLGALVSGCGSSSEPTHVEEGEVLQLGPLKYQVTFSRYLNPNDNEDVAYLVGQEEAQKESAYFGVWFEVQNETEQIQKLPTEMVVTDEEGNEYKALPSESIFAFPMGGTIEPEEQVPVLDSAAQQGPIQSSLVIFELTDEASSNRPLTLHLESPEGDKGEVQLDL